jgi:hypothetical protein
MTSQPLFRPEDYPNQLGLLHLTSSDIERQIVSYSLSFPQTRDIKVEKRIKFPQFVRAFYNFIYNKAKVPTQQEFYEYYISVNHEHFSTAQYPDEIYNGLRARVFRTYPSLVRDFHFNKVLTERIQGYEIVYNSNLDIEHDIDTLLVLNNQYWAACLYTQTRRAFVARGWKENRHIRFSNVTYIEFPVKLKDQSKLGDFFLYGERELEKLIASINNYILS